MKYEKNVHKPGAGKKITCAISWILVPQSLDGLYRMLMNGIIITHLSEWIGFNFN